MLLDFVFLQNLELAILVKPRAKEYCFVTKFLTKKMNHKLKKRNVLSDNNFTIKRLVMRAPPLRGHVDSPECSCNIGSKT